MPVRRGRRLLSKLIPPLLLLPGLCWTMLRGAAAAQSPVDGAIAGHIVGSEGEPIAGAEIVATGDDGLPRKAVSDRHGEFLLIRLPPGAYHLAAHADGYRGQVGLEVPVALGQTTELQLGRAYTDRWSRRPILSPLPIWQRTRAGIRLKVPGAEVTTLPSGTGSLVVPSDELDSLPVNGGDWQQLALDAPGAHADPDADGQVLLTLRGLATIQNSSQIDGVSSDQSFGAVPLGGGNSTGGDEDERAAGLALSGGGSGTGYGQPRRAGAAYTFSQAAIREFRLNEHSYSALYGHAAGGSLTAVTRSGTGTLHGTAFLTVRESGWAATNPFSIQTSYSNGVVTSGLVKPQDTQQQFGGSLGGPIVPRRLFFFGVHDQQRRNFPAIASPADPAFYSLTATQQALLRTRGVGAAKTMAALDYLSSLTGPVPRRRDQTVDFAKLDWQATTGNHVSAQYNRSRWNAPSGSTTDAVVPRGRASLGNNLGKVDEAVLRWTSFFTPHLSNELRAQYGRDLQFQTAQTPLPQEPAIGPGGLAPEVSIGPSGLLFGTPGSLSHIAYPDEHRTEVADTFAWVIGHHLLRIGVQANLVHETVATLPNQSGTFLYDSGTTGGHAGGLVDWITDYTFNVHAYPNGGCPTINSSVHDFCFRSFSQSFGEQSLSFSTRELAGFLQDDWRMRSNLTLNLGVRYEYEQPPVPQHPNAALDALFGSVASTSAIPTDGNNYAPRAGLSWRPGNGRWGVLRLGYGVFFGVLPGATLRSVLAGSALPTTTTKVRITPTTETACPQVANQGFGYPCAYTSAPPAAVASTTSAIVFSKRFQLPMIQQASLSLEHRLGRGTTVSATYLINLDRQLPGSVDLNIAPSTATRTFQLSGGTKTPGVRDGETFVLPLYTARLTPDFGPVTEVLSNVNGSYNALELELRHGSIRGLLLRAHFTWAKAIDEGQSTSGVPRTNAQLDPFHNLYDKGLSSLNYPHRLVLSAAWHPHLDSDSRWVRAAMNGWELAPLATLGSGRPYTYEIFGGTRLPGGRETINGSGGATYLPTVGRNTLRLPDTVNVDMRLSRTLRLRGRFHLRGVAEVFNLTNHPNYSGITQRAFLVGTTTNNITTLTFQDAAAIAAEGLNTRPFGAYTAAGGSIARERRLQLGLRLEF